jgi:xanthine dehydrogenase accessory factor
VFLFFEKLNDLLASRRPFVQVTVVDTNGSVPQDVGCKMLVTEEGLFFGTVGGGKVEARAIAEAKAMLVEAVEFGKHPLNSSGSSPANLLADLSGNLPADLPADLSANLAANLPANLPLNQDDHGGAVALRSGTLKGTGDTRARTNRHAPVNTKFYDWSLNKDIGMTCGGSVKMFMEAFYVNAWRITIFGAGHVSNALIRLLSNLDCQITCYDNRQEWLNKIPDSPRLTKIYALDLVSEVAGIGQNDFVILMTMGHTTDMPILVQILKLHQRTKLPYIGVIGSDAKAARLRKDVLDAGLSEDDARRFRCPMGMPFGTNDPNEIAVSIAAQLLEVRDTERFAGGFGVTNHCEMIRIGSDG